MTMIPASSWRMSAVVALALAAASAAEPAPSRYAAGDPGRDFDLQGFIDARLAEHQARIVVPPGRYRVKPRHAEHLVLQRLSGVTIVADGVEMICTETTRALTIRDCTDLTVRGLTIDYDPLPFTQGRITALSPDKKVHDIELFGGYPRADAARDFKYEIFDPATRTLRTHSYGGKLSVVDPAHLRLVKDGGSSDQDREQVGDLIVIGSEHAPGGSAAHAIESSRCTRLTLDHVTLYASNCFGYLEYACERTTYDHCVLDRRPADSDPVVRASPRLRSADADAFHSKRAVVGPRLLGCVARFQGDDCVNICGDYHLVMGGEGRRLRVLAKHDLDIQVGDPVELVAYDGRRLPDAVATAIAADEAIRPDETAFLRKQRMDEGLRTNAGGAATKGFAITLDRAVELPMGSVMCSARRIGNGFVIDGCEFGWNRSRGILIKASDGRITNCTLAGSWEVAILVSPEFWWLEAGSASHLVITGNAISDCPTPGIVVQATGGDGKIAPAGAHADIAISGNRFTACALPFILCTSTTGLALGANVFPADGASRQAGWGAWMVPKDERGRPVVTVACTPAAPER
jgi:hypothetical protein